MSRIIRCAHIQAANAKHDGTPAEIKEAMIQKHIPLIEEAGNKGVKILCLQEIFYGPYFCAEQDIKWYQTAEPVPGPTTERLAEYAKKWKSFYNVLRKNIALNAVSCAIENGFEAVTCGHTHYPEDMVVDGIRYINTGAWTELPAHYLYVTADGITLNTVDPSCVITSPKSPPLNQTATPMPFQPVSSGSAETGRRAREIAT